MPLREPEPDTDTAFRHIKRCRDTVPDTNAGPAKESSCNRSPDRDGRGLQPDPGKQMPPAQYGHAVRGGPRDAYTEYGPRKTCADRDYYEGKCQEVYE